MRICIFSHTFPRFPGDPAAPFMGTFAQALASRGHKVFVLTPFDSKFDLKVKRPYKLVTYKYIYPEKFHLLGYSRTLQDDKKMDLKSYFLSVFLYTFGFFALLRLVRREKIDIISSHWLIPNGFIASFVSKLTGVPYTVTIPGSDIYLGGKNIIFKKMVGFAAMNADYVVSDSNHYIKQLNDLGFFPKKTQLIRYGVDMKIFKPAKKDPVILKKLSIAFSSPVILSVGRMVTKKGFCYLADAMPSILKNASSAKLVMVGDGDQRETLERIVQKLGVKNNVVFAGTVFHNELPKYYNIADVFVMPSIKDEKGNIDASPVSMMEAMACGARIVATNFAGSEDLVLRGETGYLIEEKNSRQIADSVINLLKKRLGSGTKEKVNKIAENNFSSKVVAIKYEKIFESLV